MNPLPGQANVRCFTAIRRTDHSPLLAIETTIYYYLVALTGTHALRWRQASDSSWTSGETAFGAMADLGNDGAWYVTVPADAWDEGVTYYEYIREPYDLHAPSGQLVRCENSAPSASASATVYMG